MSAPRLVLRVERDGEAVKLSSPAVGLFTCAVAEERAVGAGEKVGVLLALGRAFELVVPEGVSGMVHNAKPELVHAPVGFGTVLYELAPLATGARAAKPTAAEGPSVDAALVFRSPSAGRFWHRSAPSDPPLLNVGDVIEAGRAIGLIEVMKTFTLVGYTPAGELPARARVRRVIAADGAEVAEKAPLIEVEPA